MNKYVIYKRVSTGEQGKSGLGLKAQQRDIDLFLGREKEEFGIAGEFEEIQSGGDDDRPILKEAILLAKRRKATLLVSKLDRLSRKVSTIAKLMEDESLDFKVASMPNAKSFELHIYAALAEQERKFIGQRTAAALLEYKEWGFRWATRDDGTQVKVDYNQGGLRDKTGERNKALMEQADARAKKLEGIIMPLRTNGKTLRQIGDALEATDIKTARGNDNWTPSGVRNVIKRLEEA